MINTIIRTKKVTSSRIIKVEETLRGKISTTMRREKENNNEGEIRCKSRRAIINRCM